MEKKGDDDSMLKELEKENEKFEVKEDEFEGEMIKEYKIERMENMKK